jgi:hypothetical protein
MASAPRPGALKAAQAGDQAFVITVDGVPQRLVVSDLGPQDAVRIRRLKLGFSLAGMMALLADEQQMDIDIPCTLWWLARVKNGENRLTYEQASAEFPGYDDFTDRVTIEVEGDDVEDPEGDDDPLSSAGD